MGTMLAALLLLMFTGQALSAERTSCEVQPVRGDLREWHYRTKVGGDPRVCWYPGERMKPRSELYWDSDTTRLSAPSSDAVEPKDTTALEPGAPEPKDTTALEPDAAEPKDTTGLKRDAVELEDATVLEGGAVEPSLILTATFAERWRALEDKELFFGAATD
jgi:hypothetical protein